MARVDQQHLAAHQGLCLGMTVLWFPYGVENTKRWEQRVGIVSAIGEDSCNLHILVPGSQTFLVRDGVRHIADPRVNEPAFRELGAWAHTEWNESILTLFRKKEL